jgi:hypothetical protein
MEKVNIYSLIVCLISIHPYLIENHVIAIRIRGTTPPRDVLLERYNKVIQSFSNEKTKTFINLYFGNNAINTTELKYVLPIYL